MAEPLIVAKDIKRAFPVAGGLFWATKGISLEIPRNKLTVLRGRSGSGKTTLMNMLGALDTPTSGTIYFEGKDMTSCSDRERDELRRTQMGFVFQSVALVSMMNAAENVEFGLRIAGYPASKRMDRVMECLRLVGLAGRANHMPQEMSGGEQQRVAIARAIAHGPKIIFADEPTAELDSNTGLQVIKIFREMTDSTTLVICTHDEAMASVADCVFELEDGELK